MNRKFEALFVSVGIVCMIVGLIALAQSTVPSGGPYYLQVPTSTWTYLVDRFSNGSYYMVNGTNWKVDYQSTNLTKVEQYALGNMTSGTLYLNQQQHNTSLTISMNVKAIEDYQNRTIIFTSTGSRTLTDCPVATTSTFTLTSDTTEHTIVTLTPTSVEQVTNF